MITKLLAIELARAEFAKTGRPLVEYQITVDPDGGEQEPWVVWFDLKGPFPIPGGRHIVTVNKVTGATVFMPGE